ncbi:hypothetical protein NVV93_11030 [Pseudomonas sp. LS44]|uniref:hypothetical protein n=1 Tax=Pseudomonas sp. LS44 TaxID=1357074 RepID=UPI00215B5550|nr:hypothetical protein [Pseudomonas sp. LS44]UVE16164.1 hypothetical protein NVV93_11030 [Pseudomonas sp. LS44]
MSYNQAELGDLLMVALPNRPSTSILRKIIEARRVKECDYRLFRSACDEHGQRYPKDKLPLVLQRITDKKIRTIQPFPALAANMAKEAEQRGTTYNFSKPQNPAIPGPPEQFSE